MIPPRRLQAVLRRLRGGIRLRARRTALVDALPQAQLDLLKALSAAPDSRVTDLAARLQLAPNTVSTLATRMRDAGLVERTSDPSDGRGVRLRVTARAERELALWRDHREEVLGEALAELPERDRALIAAALPALERLAERLQAGARPGGPARRGR